MTCDYEAIRSENIKRYGTDIGRIGRMLLTDRYDERTHFIFELLQNAEDALTRRAGWQGSRAVSFDLTETSLRVSHYGDPFDEADVRGICGIAESTKDINEIGRFGIGFKSVYAFTERPEIHSGLQDFAIEKFVCPIAVPAIERHEDETVIQIPFKPDDNAAQDEIATGLRQLGIYGLLFLHQIDEISWRVEGGASGQYLRESKDIDTDVRRVTIIGKQEGENEIDEEWLIFSRLVDTDNERSTKPVEIAFSCIQDEKSKRIHRINRSPLVVFFPTAVETHLGFLVQGPYRTTPSRDNIPKDDDWNRHLVNETSALLQETLCWLRDHHLLDTEVLQCLPLDSTKFDNTNMFSPLFEATKEALSSKPLLPRFDAGYVPAARAWLGRSQELRALFSPTQLTTLYRKEYKQVWLSADITQSRASDLRTYLMQELNVAEITPEGIIRKLNQAFLKAQSDEWIQKLYEFLMELPSLKSWFTALPLIRLEDGSHVAVKANGKLAAFLPTKTATGFPTVRCSVCITEPAREFLQSLGLKEPDPVDDIIENVLPTYQKDKIDINYEKYEADIQRILNAFGTDSETQRKRLIGELRESTFVRAVDAGDGSKWYVKPSSLYLATERLRNLFDGIIGVRFVDDSFTCLQGESIREMLEACGAARNLQTIAVRHTFTDEEKREMRRKAGCENSTWEGQFNDRTLRGLSGLLLQLPELCPDARKEKAKLLWEALTNLEGRSGSGVFTCTYSWFYHRSRSTKFDAVFVKKLNSTAWIPDTDGKLQRPEFVLFDSLGWNEHPFLQSKIHFKPPIIETLAREAGLEPGILDLLKKAGVTSEDELRARLGLEDETKKDGNGTFGKTKDGEDNGGGRPDRRKRRKKPVITSGNGDGKGGDKGEGKNSRQFISYVATHSEKENPDPDGLTYKKRMDLESMAIALILEREPDWQQTPINNPGYDLYKINGDDGQKHYCEVKAMSGSLKDRPVGLSHTQFKYAYDHGENYWLYVVEHAGNKRSRIVKIQDPAGKARTFTFDHGWINVAITDDDSNEQET